MAAECAGAMAYSTASAPQRFLQEAAVAPRTRDRYVAAVAAFMQWATGDAAMPTTALRARKVDGLLSDYLHHLFFSGKSFSLGSATLFGLELLDARLKGGLPSSRLALRGWRNQVPKRSYPPLTWDAACAIAVTLACWGERAAAIAVLTSFDCYLRVGEMAALRVADVIDATSVRMGSAYRGMSLILKQTKTGPNKSVDVRRPVVRELVAELVHGKPLAALVFDTTAARFRRIFKAAAAMLGLSSDYVPHSLRHGGATCDYLNGVGMDTIITRGRWASHKTASRYVQAGRAMLAARIDFPPRIARLGALLAPEGALRRAFAVTRTAPIIRARRNARSRSTRPPSPIHSVPRSVHFN